MQASAPAMPTTDPFDTTGPAPGEVRRIASLAWPVILTSLNWTILHVTDVVVVGLVGAHQVAALGASRSLTFVGIVTGLAWLSGVLVTAARTDGAGDRVATGAALRDGLALGLGIGIAAALLLWFGAAPMLRGLGVAAALIDPAAAVVRVMAVAYPFQLLIVAASFFLEGVSRPRRVAAVNMAILPLNALLAWAWSGGHLGFAGRGAVGAASATVVASIIGAVIMVASALLLPDARARGLRTWRVTIAGVMALGRFGIVPALASGLELGGFSILIALSTRFGDDTAHAFQIVFAVHNVTYGIAIGLGSAAGVRVGNAIGEGQRVAAIARTRIALALAVGLLAGAALLLGFEARTIVRGFPAADAVHAIAGSMLPLWAPFILFDGAQVVLVYALRSLGDQVAAGINSIVAYFVVTGGLGWLLVMHGAASMALVWASAAGMVAAALLHTGRFVMVSARLRRQNSVPAASNSPAHPVSPN